MTMHMQFTRCTRVGVVLAAISIFATFGSRVRSTEINLTFDTSAENFPAYDPDGSKLAFISNAAAQIWETLLPESGHTYSVNVHYGSYPADSTQLAVYNDFDHTINVRNNTVWFLDSTPLQNEEFGPFQQVLARNLSGDESDSLVGSEPDLLETGYFALGLGDASSPPGSANNSFDLFTVMLHEMGHFTEIGYNLLKPDVSLVPKFIGNVSGVAVKREDESHIIPDEALLDPFLEMGKRTLPSALDVIVAAHEQNHNTIRLSRVDWFGDANIPFSRSWGLATGWEGARVPNSNVDVTIRNGHTVVVQGIDTGARRLRILDDSGLNIVSGSLLVDGDLELSSNDYNDDSHVDVQADGVLDVGGRLHVNYGMLKMLGGNAFVHNTVIEENNFEFLQPRIQGHGNVIVSGNFSNRGMIEAKGGTLVLKGSAGVVLDLDGDTSTSVPRLRALEGSLEFQRPLADSFHGEVQIAGSESLTYAGDWNFDDAELQFQDGPGLGDFSSLSPTAQVRLHGNVVAEAGASARVRAGTINIDHTDVIVNQGAELAFVGDIRYQASELTGEGTIRQNGNAVVQESSMVEVQTFDWDGNQAVLSNTTIAQDQQFTIHASSLGPGGFGGDVELLDNASLAMELSNAFGSWILDETGLMRLHRGSHVTGSTAIVQGEIEAVTGTSHIESAIVLTSASTVVISDHATLNLEGNIGYGGGLITTNTGSPDGSMLQQLAPATVIGHHLITTGFFNWDASNATDSHTVIQEDGYLDIFALEIGNGVTNPLLAIFEREGFGDQLDINSGVLRVSVGSDDHSGTYADAWKLNPSGEMNLNRTTAELPSVRGSKLLSRGTIRGNGQFFGPLTNAGVVEVGYAGSAGQIRALDVFTQEAAGLLAIDLGGHVPIGEYDQLIVGDAANLAGTLEVSLISGFVPLPGDLFRILNGSDNSVFDGTFNHLQLPYGTQAWDVIYGDHFVDLRFVAVPEPASYVSILSVLGLATLRRRVSRQNLRSVGETI